MSDQEYEEQEGLEEEEEYQAPTFEEMMAARKLTVEDIKEHISGPVVSVIVHVIILAILSTIIVFHPPDEGKNIEVKEVVVEVKPLEKKIEPPEPEEPPEETEIDVETPSPDVAETPSPTVEDVAVDAPNQDVTVPNILTVKPSNSALVMPALFGGRSGSGRAGALKRYGGGRRTERAVLKALRWLKDHQNEDGSWGEGKPEDHPALTGMALLAFLAHGETPSSTEFGNTVLKAIKKLIEFVGPDGNGVKGGYRHGIAVYALSEAYACTKIPMLESVMNAGVTRLIAGLNAGGAFDYGYKHGGRSDMSVSGWNYQALKAAFAAGCSAPGLEAAIDKSISVGLKQTLYVQGQKCFCYCSNGGAQQGPKGTMTAAATLCLQLFGAGKAPQALAGMKYLETNEFKMDWHNPGCSGWPIYQWYYETQCFFQGYSGKGGKWQEWNKMFSRTLVHTQESDGRWDAPDGNESKHLPGLNNPIYSTSLCCLMLEVYYRYLPTFKVAHVKPAASADGGAEGGGDDLDLN